MFFLIDDKHKVLFGWSAKCGCTHIKTIFRYLRDNIIDYNKIHVGSDYSYHYPKDIENYTTIIVSRNPFKRLVSGFLEKYNKDDGTLRHVWKDRMLTFSAFVDELVTNEWTWVEKHHFTPQTSEAFHPYIFKSKNVKIYDIANIDYSFIETIYDKKIPDELICFKGGHERKKMSEKIETPIYDMNIDDYYNKQVDLKYFFNEEIKQKIINFFKNDFDLFEKSGNNYRNIQF